MEHRLQIDQYVQAHRTGVFPLAIESVELAAAWAKQYQSDGEFALRMELGATAAQAKVYPGADWFTNYSFDDLATAKWLLTRGLYNSITADSIKKYTNSGKPYEILLRQRAADEASLGQR